jgi:hypothetical protein
MLVDLESTPEMRVDSGAPRSRGSTPMKRTDEHGLHLSPGRHCQGVEDSEAVIGTSASAESST